MIILYGAETLVYMVCYVIMCRKVSISSTLLRKVGHRFPQNVQDQQKDKAKTLLYVIICDVVCTLPITITAPFIDISHIWIYGVLSLYNVQYAMRFFIYFRSNYQYQQAYILGWKAITCQLRKAANLTT